MWSHKPNDNIISDYIKQFQFFFRKLIFFFIWEVVKIWESTDVVECGLHIVQYTLTLADEIKKERERDRERKKERERERGREAEERW